MTYFLSSSSSVPPSCNLSEPGLFEDIRGVFPTTKLSRQDATVMCSGIAKKIFRCKDFLECRLVCAVPACISLLMRSVRIVIFFGREICPVMKFRTIATPVILRSYIQREVYRLCVSSAYYFISYCRVRRSSATGQQTTVVAVAPRRSGAYVRAAATTYIIQLSASF